MNYALPKALGIIYNINRMILKMPNEKNKHSVEGSAQKHFIED